MVTVINRRVSKKVATATSNTIPIDDAPYVDVGKGVRGRYGLCPVDCLKDNPNSARTHSKRQLKKLTRSMSLTGTWTPVVIDEHYVILAGHGRKAAAKLNGDKQIPVVQLSGATEAQKRLYLIADNRIAEDAGWDRKKLALDLPDLTVVFNESKLNFTDTGFEIAEIDQFVADFEPDSSDPTDDVDESILAIPPVLQTGDLFTLGDHKLLIGDARNHADLDRLRGDLLVSAAFLDPPYNVPVRDTGGRGRVQHQDFAFASGEMSDVEYIAFLKDALRNAARVSKPGALHYVCMDWKHIRALIEAGEIVYSAFINLVVWNKTNAGQGGLYRNQHELIAVFRAGNQPHMNNVQQGRFDRNRSNVWTYAGANTFRKGRMEDLKDHPTVKPVRMVVEALKDCTKPGDVVLDTFGGAGTTLLAAERVGRHALLMEIEPKYAEITIRRWQKQSGRDAVHAETGMTFDELIVARRVD